MVRGKLAARHNTYAIKIHWGSLKIPFQLYICKLIVNLDPAASQCSSAVGHVPGLRGMALWPVHQQSQVCLWAELRFSVPWPRKMKTSIVVKVKYGFS